MEITPTELREFTEKPLLAVLSTVNPDGSPQATPLWHHYDGEQFNMTAFTTRVKVRNIRRNPKVSLVVVDTARRGGQGLVVNGTAVLIEVGVPEATLRNAIRYLGEGQGHGQAADRDRGASPDSRHARAHVVRRMILDRQALDVPTSPHLWLGRRANLREPSRGSMGQSPLAGLGDPEDPPGREGGTRAQTSQTSARRSLPRRRHG